MADWHEKLIATQLQRRGRGEGRTKHLTLPSLKMHQHVRNEGNKYLELTTDIKGVSKVLF
jgi:hypothetical protein